MTNRFRTRQRVQLESLERRDLLSVTPRLVGDLNLAPPEAELQSDNAWLGDEVLFAADDGTGDVELWKSDGTAEGTVRVKDIRSGARGSLPRDFTTANGRVMFTAYSDEFGRELWATDGTEDGTVLVEDLAPGTESLPIDSLTAVGDDVYFRFDGALWNTDGTSAGTEALTTLKVHWLTPFKEKLFFTDKQYADFVLSEDGDRELELPELWVSDGTQDGTIPLKATLTPQALIASGDVAFISGYEGLWRSDGTSDGTIMISDQVGEAIAEFGSDVYFNRGNQLWKSNGMPEGTQRVKRLASDEVGWSWSISAVEDMMLLSVGTQLWRSDGTTEGTERVRSFAGALRPISTLGDTVYFTSNGELWQSDGSEDGTLPVPDIENVKQQRELNGALYFSGNRGDVGQELIRIDGTDAEPQLLDISPGPADSNPWVMADNGEMTLFWSTKTESRGLWATTESFETPTLLNDSILGPSGHIGSQFDSDVSLVEIQGKALIEAAGQRWITDGLSTNHVEADDFSFDYAALDDHFYFLHGNNLWRRDSSTAKAALVADMDNLVVRPYGLTEAGGRLYFWAGGTDDREKLWVLDEGQSNPTIVKDFQMPPRSFFPHSMVNANGELLFAFDTDGHTELWKTNESAELAERVTVVPGSQSKLIAAEDQIFMGGDGGWWRTDGTADGTYSLYDNRIDTDQATISGNRLFFLGSSDDAGEELWVSDGTVTGTHLVKDIVPGRVGCRLADMVALEETLFFGATDEYGIRALWKSDGTPEGTEPVMQTDAYPISSGDGVVYFHGGVSSTGSELWKSDGTQEGTVQVVDLNAGPDDSRKYRTAGTAAEINGNLYFAGDDGFHGYELWQIPLDSQTPSVPGDANRDGLFDSSDLVQVFQHAEYEDQIDGNSTWEDGDWNGDGDFTTSDLVLAFQSGGYQAAAMIHSSQFDGASLVDWASDPDHKKRMPLDPDSIDESLKQGVWLD